MVGGKANVASWQKTCLFVLIAASTAGAGASHSDARDRAGLDAEGSAFEVGIRAYRERSFESAIPALEAAAKQDDGKHDNLFAMYYLARIYSDHSRAYSDDARAYHLFKAIVDRYYNIDRDDFRRAPTVGDAITWLARYVQHGVVEIGLLPNKAYAVRLYREAAHHFNAPNAQYELAKLQLTGDGVRRDVRSALYWFGRLANRAHAGAQATLADLYWRGKYVRRDQFKALLLITHARRNAPPHELIWIDELYQEMYCGTASEPRERVQSEVAGWLDQADRSREGEGRATLDNLDWLEGPRRACSDGQPVIFPKRFQDGVLIRDGRGAGERQIGGDGRPAQVEAKRPIGPRETTITFGFTGTLPSSR